MAVLVFLHGPQAGNRFTLSGDEMTIGRRSTNDVVLKDPQVSRVHAVVMRRGGALIIEDLGSHNGTYINGERISGPRQLHHGDSVTIGESKGTVEDPMRAGEESTAVAAASDFAGATMTQRQVQVLRLMARGLSNKQIGERLGVTERTGKAYVASIFEKLGVNKRAAAVAEGLRLGIIDPPQGDD